MSVPQEVQKQGSWLVNPVTGNGLWSDILAAPGFWSGKFGSAVSQATSHLPGFVSFTDPNAPTFKSVDEEVRQKVQKLFDEKKGAIQEVARKGIEASLQTVIGFVAVIPEEKGAVYLTQAEELIKGLNHGSARRINQQMTALVRQIEQDTKKTT